MCQSTLPADMFGGSDFWLETIIIIKNWVPSILLHNLWLIFMGMKQKKIKLSIIGDFEKWPFFESAILNFIFQKKKIFASFQWKQVKVYWSARMDRNFDDYPGLQPKITPPKHFSRQCKTRSYTYNVHFITTQCNNSLFEFIYVLYTVKCPIRPTFVLTITTQ
jgi:hypothetical protein